MVGARLYHAAAAHGLVYHLPSASKAILRRPAVRGALPENRIPGSEMNERNFFAELKRRNVYKVAVAYAVVGWLVIQIASTILPTFHAPEWVVQTLIVIVALGFPIALVTAWAFEMTPGGLKRTA